MLKRVERIGYTMQILKLDAEDVRQRDELNRRTYVQHVI